MSLAFIDMQKCYNSTTEIGLGMLVKFCQKNSYDQSAADLWDRRSRKGQTEVNISRIMQMS